MIRGPAAGLTDRRSERDTLDRLVGAVQGGQSQARTVEWHLREVFTKLGVRSRRQLRLVMADHGRPVTAS